MHFIVSPLVNHAVLLCSALVGSSRRPLFTPTGFKYIADALKFKTTRQFSFTYDMSFLNLLSTLMYRWSFLYIYIFLYIF